MHKSIKQFKSLLWESYQIYFKNLPAFLRGMIILFVPFFIVDRLFFMGVQLDEIAFAYFNESPIYVRELEVTIAEFIILITLAVAITVALFILYQIIILKTYEKIDQKQHICTVNIYQESLKLFVPFCLVNGLFALWVSIWSLLFIIPGFVVGFFYCFAIFAFMFDDKRGKEALLASKEIIKNNTNRVLGSILGMLLVAGVLYISVIMLLEYIFAVHIQCDPTTKARMGELIQDLITMIFGAYPFIFIAILYKDLRNNLLTS